MAAEFLTSLLDATVRAGTVLVLAGLGEVIANRSGVLNLGVEGMVTVGALVGFVVGLTTGNLWLGFAAGALGGTAMASIHAILCVSMKADQVISGIMLTLLGIGLTTYFGGAYTGESIDGFSRTTLPVVGDALTGIPVVGEALFINTPTDFLAIALVPVVWYFLNRTRLGLELTAVGDDPETADTMGVSVFKMRYACVLLGGAFAGAAGAHLSLSFAGLWVNEIAAGRGWIAIVLVIFAQWNPVKILLGAYLFGGVEAFTIRSQGISPSVGEWVPMNDTVAAALEFLMNPEIMSSYPYIVTIVVLVVAVRAAQTGQIAAPTALLENYSREGN